MLSAMLLATALSVSTPAPGHAHTTMTMVMSDDAMRERSLAWFAAHPATGASATRAAVATFKAVNNSFDLDNNAGTVVDTAKIQVGESVSWTWVNGTHTTTNGTGSDDPQMGSLWNQPLDLTHPQFTYLFDTAGEYPFFCVFHDFLEMKGVVVVKSVAGVGSSTAALGFTSGPRPNPSRAGIEFTFSLTAPGHVLAEVFDTRGRRVAEILDRDFVAGEHAGSWNGAVAGGARAGAGVYYLRLHLPAYQATRRIVLTR